MKLSPADGSLAAPPAWLKLHVPQDAAVGVVQQDGEIGWPGGDGETGLSYHPDQGVIISRERTLRSPREEEDESYD